MRIVVHDVGHGACSVLTLPNGRRMMIDCGSSVTWSPSSAYAGRIIDCLVLQNLDTDHLSDLPALLRRTQVRRFFSNPSVSNLALAAMKAECGMSVAVQEAHSLLRRYGTQYGPNMPLSDCIADVAMWHAYGQDFTDTNNLSVPLFIACGMFTILFGGDMEEAGWRLLLQRPYFREMLGHVKVYVASHHGRENGCCEELFYYMRPDVVIISDYEHRHDTQKTTAWYANRVNGIPDYTVYQSLFAPRPVRKVLTTRYDGHLEIKPELDGGFWVNVNASTDVDRAVLPPMTAAARRSFRL